MAGSVEPAPKDRVSAVDLRAIAREVRGLVGGHLDKAFDLEPEGTGLAFRGRSRARSELWVVPGRYAAIAPSGGDHAEGLSPLAREIRRIATGASLQSVAEPAGERYLELTLGRASEGSTIVIAAELFGAGNLVLAVGGRIASAAHPRRWARRDVRPGAPYSRPPARPDAFGLTASEIESELARSRTDLASTLAARLALGGPVAEEAIARAGWDAAAAASPRAHEVAPTLHALLATLIGEVGDAPHGFLVRRAGVVVDATPYRPHRWGDVPGVELVETPTFSEAAIAYFGSLLHPTVRPEVARRATEIATLTRLRDRQRAALEELADGVRARRDDADAVFAHFAEVEAALAAARTARPTPRTVRVVLGERRVEVPMADGARAAAQALYEEGKRLAAKRDGARGALTVTEGRLLQTSDAPLERGAPASRRSDSVRSARWFEKFRWFASSDGALVLGGRDAGSNDLLVRRHLKDGDVYVHADLHGAASVIVKRPPAVVEVPEPTIREAAQWAVAFSKAWRAGLASASAFWARPDQVSKSAGSGEFVARGAWVVRGTKHFVPDVPLELAVGPVRYDGEEFLMVAPPSAVRARGTLRFLIRPGEERERADREIELARELGVSRSRLQTLLPAGGLEVRRA